MAKRTDKTEKSLQIETQPTAEQKMTIYEYEQKYTKRQNVRGAKILLRLVVGAIAILIAVGLAMLTIDLWDKHMYAGIAGAVVSVLLYIFLFIVPLVKICKLDYFHVNVNAKTARAAQKHNKKLRKEIADKIIDITSKCDGAGWYDSETVGKLAIALKAGNEAGIKNHLTALYSGSVKKSAKTLIFNSSLKSAMYSALSQTSKTDALLVAFLNLQLIKDIVFLYGFRPSDVKLVRIFARVLQNSLIAYGLGNIKIGNSIAKTMGDVVKGVPILGTAISALVDSSVQGLTNGVLTAVIGYQTIKYLNDEYKMQNILDGVDVSIGKEELDQTCADIERELKGKKYPQAS